MIGRLDAVNVAIALGSNLGDRAAHLEYAVSRLNDLLTDLRVSRFRDTEPVGVQQAQGRYLNAVAVGKCALPPHALLQALLDIERNRGRERPYVNAARTLDLDLILYGNVRLDLPALVLPHPRFRERRFVLEPLVEIAPDFLDPVTGRSVTELLKELRA